MIFSDNPEKTLLTRQAIDAAVKALSDLRIEGIPEGPTTASGPYAIRTKGIHPSAITQMDPCSLDFQESFTPSFLRYRQSSRNHPRGVRLLTSDGVSEISTTFDYQGIHRNSGLNFVELHREEAMGLAALPPGPEYQAEAGEDAIQPVNAFDFMTGSRYFAPVQTVRQEIVPCLNILWLCDTSSSNTWEEQCVETVARYLGPVDNPVQGSRCFLVNVFTQLDHVIAFTFISYRTDQTESRTTSCLVTYWVYHLDGMVDPKTGNPYISSPSMVLAVTSGRFTPYFSGNGREWLANHLLLREIGWYLHPNGFSYAVMPKKEGEEFDKVLLKPHLPANQGIQSLLLGSLPWQSRRIEWMADSHAAIGSLSGNAPLWCWGYIPPYEETLPSRSVSSYPVPSANRLMNLLVNRILGDISFYNLSIEGAFSREVWYKKMDLPRLLQDFQGEARTTLINQSIIPSLKEEAKLRYQFEIGVSQDRHIFDSGFGIAVNDALLKMKEKYRAKEQEVLAKKHALENGSKTSEPV